MRVAFVVVVVLHGLLHVLGFAKAFGLASLPQLTQSISRPMGVLWLVAGLAMLATAGSFAAGLRWAWMVGLAATVLSEVVIASSWTDARFGTLANVVVLVVCLFAALAVAPWSYAAAYARDARAVLASSSPGPIVVESDLAPLPAPVARWLRASGVVGRPRTRAFRVHMTGAIRSRASTPWMPFVATQTSGVDPPTRLFFMQASRGGIPFDVWHRYASGTATMQVRLASLVRIVDGRGPLLDRSETVTFLNDACGMAPGALLDPRFRFAPIDDRHARVSFACAGHDVSAELTFDDADRLVDFASMDRARSEDGKTGEVLRWTTPLGHPRTFEGRTVGAHGDAIWHAPEGAYVYGRFEIGSIEHDPRA